MKTGKQHCCHNYTQRDSKESAHTGICQSSEYDFFYKRRNQSIQNQSQPYGNRILDSFYLLITRWLYLYDSSQNVKRQSRSDSKWCRQCQRYCLIFVCFHSILHPCTELPEKTAVNVNLANYIYFLEEVIHQKCNSEDARQCIEHRIDLITVNRYPFCHGADWNRYDQ